MRNQEIRLNYVDKVDFNYLISDSGKTANKAKWYYFYLSDSLVKLIKMSAQQQYCDQCLPPVSS